MKHLILVYFLILSGRASSQNCHVALKVLHGRCWVLSNICVDDSCSPQRDKWNKQYYSLDSNSLRHSSFDGRNLKQYTLNNYGYQDDPIKGWTPFANACPRDLCFIDSNKNTNKTFYVLRLNYGNGEQLPMRLTFINDKKFTFTIYNSELKNDSVRLHTTILTYRAVKVPKRLKIVANLLITSSLN